MSDGRTLHVYDAAADGADDRLAVFWHHGTPNLGAPPEPLFAAAAEHGIRWVSHDRPGYGGSTPRPGRDVASVPADVSSIADALGIEQFAVMGHSGGCPYAFGMRRAPARAGPRRGLRGRTGPIHAEGLDWFAGMAASGEAELRAAAEGRAALEGHFASTDFDPEVFTSADHAALAGSWSWLGAIAGKAIEGGRGGMVDDDLSYVAPWGFDPWQVRSSGLWLRPDDGHISVLHSGDTALGWLREHAIQG